ncbi:MAG: hypothetical protein V4692_07990 [Bdellovibrionota bacterium]
MKKFGITAAMLALSMASHSYAEVAQENFLTSTNPATVEDKGCKVDSSDKEDLGFRISDFSNNLKGKCVDGNKFRPGRVFNETSTSVQVTNFLHDNKFWTATVPLGRDVWEKNYLHIVMFDVVKGVSAAHSQLRFVLRSPLAIKLESQSGLKSSARVNSFVLTVEGSFPAGVAFNAADGGYDNYPLVGRIESSEQRLLEDPINETMQFVLRLDPKTKIDSPENRDLRNKHALASLYKSQDIGLKKFYNTIRPNCVSEVFDLIDSVRGIPHCVPGKAGEAERARAGLCVRRFNVGMSLDPVYGPAKLHMTIRKIFYSKAPSLKEELQPSANGTKKHKVIAGPGLLRTDIYNPYALVTISKNDPTSVVASKAIQKQVEASMKEVVPLLTSGAILPSLASTSASGAIAGVLKLVQSKINDAVMKINKQLPKDQPTYLVAYLSPWDKTAEALTFTEDGFPADVPFNYSPNIGVTPEKAKELTDRVTAKLRSLQSREFKKKMPDGKAATPVFAMGAVIRLKLQYDKSVSTIQLVLGMVPQDLPFSTAAMVNLTRIRIPTTPVEMYSASGAKKLAAKAKNFMKMDYDSSVAQWNNTNNFERTMIATTIGLTDRETWALNKMATTSKAEIAALPRPTMLISHHQPINYRNYIHPVVDITFGAFNPIQTDNRSADYGLVKLQTAPAACAEALDLIPEMQGTGMADALGAKPIPWTMDLKTLGNQVMSNGKDAAENVWAKSTISLGIKSLSLVMTEEYCGRDLKGRSEKDRLKFCHAAEGNTTGAMVWDMHIKTRVFGNAVCAEIPFINETVTGEANASLEYEVKGIKKKVKESFMNVMMGNDGQNAKIARAVIQDTLKKKLALEAAQALTK